MKIFRRIKAFHRLWKNKRFLKKHGCISWKQYRHRYDPDINVRAARIKDFYHGYPYIHVFENYSHKIYFWDLDFDGAHVITSWCRKNCKDKYRLEFQRVIKHPQTKEHWILNGLGGRDYVFAAFKNPKDYTLFLLRWGD